MYVCDDCHAGKTCSHFTTSFGPCELCGKVKPCLFCYAHHLPAPANTTAQDQKKERAMVARMKAKAKRGLK